MRHLRSVQRVRRRLVMVAAFVTATVGLAGVPGVSAGSLTVFADGFESGSMTAWSTAANVSVRTTERHGGAYAARATSTGAPTFAQRALATPTGDVTLSAWFKIVSVSSEASVLVVRTSTGPLVTLSLAKTKRLSTRNAVTGATVNSTTTPAAGIWHLLQLRVVTGAAGQQEVWLDGEKVAALSLTQNMGNSPVAAVQIGGTDKNRKYDFAFDDVAVTAQDTTAPTVPANVTATLSGPHDVVLRWGASSDASGVITYEVSRDGVPIASAVAITEHADAGLASATTYRYTVVATDGSGNRSAASASATATTPDTSPPTVPALTSATATAFDRVALTWSAATDDVGVAGSGVYRGDVEVATVPAGTTSYVDTGLAGASTYLYSVDAFDAAGNRSERSDPLGATTPQAPDLDAPSPPGNLVAVAAGPHEVGLTWTQSSDNIGIETYRILRDGIAIGEVAATTDPYVDQVFTDTSARPSTTYGYAVDAADRAGNRSAPSAPATVTTPDDPDTEPPSDPSPLAATAPLPTEVNLAWSPSTDDRGVTGYRILRDGEPVADVDGSASTYADVAVDPRTHYAYAVRAMDAAGNASTAATASITTPALPCDASGGGLPTTESSTYRAFTDSSIWNMQIGSAPADCNSDAMIDWLRTDSTTDFIRLAGAGENGDWGNPIYWSTESDPAVAVTNSCGTFMPPEFQAIRIPLDAEPDDTSDAAMTVYDLVGGFVGAFHWTVKTVTPDGTISWSACGGSVYHLASNGLEQRAEGADDLSNWGHRGVPAPTYAVRWDEIQAGSIDHALKIAIQHTCDHVWPMVGDEGCDTGGLIPEGTRIRIRPEVDIASFGLSPQALVIARALQRYGAYIGDQSGGPVALKLENTVAEGRGWLWNGVLDARSLSVIPLSAYEVVERGWRPPP